MNRRNILILAAGLALPLGACDVKKADPGNTTEPAVANGVARDEVAQVDAGPPVVPMAAATVIQSQPGPDGSQVDLLAAKVTGDILTVTMRCSSQEKFNSESFKIADISVIDDATSQRIGVLKDNEGKAMVSKLMASGNPDNHALSGDCTVKPGVMWAKFPAPPATSKTISINFPEIAPFDGVAVQR